MLNKIYRFLNVPNITVGLIVCQVMALFMIMSGNLDPSLIDMRADKLLSGEFWRIFTFVVIPPNAHPLFIIFAWMIFYMFGTGLEQYWGSGKYNCFLLSGFVISVLISFVLMNVPVSNTFVMTAVFLAFAYYNPNFELLLFFILPLKIKWLALIIWLGFGVVVVLGTLPDILIVIAATGNFFLFLGADIYRKLRGRQKASIEAISKVSKQPEAFHTCYVCGKTDISHPDMKFRYCSLCDGGLCYCEEHINNHEHVVNHASGEQD